MAACGAPEKNPDHARNIVDVALSLMRHIRMLPTAVEMGVNIRIGMKLSLADSPTTIKKKIIKISKVKQKPWFQEYIRVQQ